MTQQHPISPSWKQIDAWKTSRKSGTPFEQLLTMAAQWGADQELEACCTEASFMWSPRSARELRAARRPKPPSIKRQSIAMIDLIQGNEKSWELKDLDVVRQALEELPDD